MSHILILLIYAHIGHGDADAEYAVGKKGAAVKEGLIMHLSPYVPTIIDFDMTMLDFLSYTQYDAEVAVKKEGSCCQGRPHHAGEQRCRHDYQASHRGRLST